MAPAEAQALQVEVVYCPTPGRCDRVSLRLPEGACVGDAIAASGLCERHGLAASAIETGGIVIIPVKFNRIIVNNPAQSHQ